MPGSGIKAHVEGKGTGGKNPRTMCGKSAKLNRTLSRYEFSWNGKLDKCSRCLRSLKAERDAGERVGLGPGRSKAAMRAHYRLIFDIKRFGLTFASPNHAFRTLASRGWSRLKPASVLAAQEAARRDAASGNV